VILLRQVPRLKKQPLLALKNKIFSKRIRKTFDRRAKQKKKLPKQQRKASDFIAFSSFVLLRTNFNKSERCNTRKQNAPKNKIHCRKQIKKSFRALKLFVK
jgi:hypothetical protein